MSSPSASETSDRASRTIARPHLLLGASLAAVGWVFLVAAGVPAMTSVGLVAIVGAQTVAAGYLWALIRRGRAGSIEVAGMGMATGTALAVISGLASQLIGVGTVGMWGPGLLAVILWVARRDWRRPSRVATVDRATGSGLAAAVLVGTASLIPNLMSYPLTWSGVWSRYHPDMLYFEALATSLARLGPLDSIFTPDAQIRYHWLAYAWTGQVSEAVAAAPFTALTRVLPFVAVMGSSLIGIAWARRMSSAVWAPALAVLLLVTGGYVGATYGAIFNFDSPSQALASTWLLAFAFAVSTLLGERRDPVPRWSTGWLIVMIGVLAFVMAGGKISAGAVGVASAGFVMLVGLVRREPWRGRAVLATAASVAAFVLGYVLVVAGSADPGGLRLFSLLDRGSSVQGLNPLPGDVGIVMGTLILMVAIAARWSGIVWLLGRRDTRWSPDTQLGLGLVLAALVTIGVLSGGLNDTWFALAASAPLAVISAAGAGQAWLSTGARRWPALWGSLAVAVIALLVVTGLWMTGASGGNVWVSTWRWAAPIAGVLIAGVGGGLLVSRLARGSSAAFLAGSTLTLVLLSATGRLLGVGTDLVGVQPGLSADAFAPVASFADSIDQRLVTEWSDEQVAAASWIRTNADRDDLVATNVTFSPFVPALTGQQTLASGILYQAPYGRPGIEPVLLEREEQSWAFIDGPSALTAEALCRSGVDWLWVDPTRTETGSWEPYATVAYENATAIVLSVSPGTCT